MMYTDYYAISSCAFSVLFIPFTILAAFHLCCALQSFGYSTRAYMRWLRCTFPITVLPPIILCAMAVTAQFALRAYLRNTYLDELAIIIGYAAWLLLASICLGLSFWRYAKSLGRLFAHVPRIADTRLSVMFICSSLIAAVCPLILNLYGWRPWMYVLPMLVPFVAPLVNLCMGKGAAAHSDASRSELFSQESW